MLATSAARLHAQSVVAVRERDWLIAPWWVFAGLASASAASLVLYGRGLWFFFDEWRFIFDRQLTFADLMRPHNEHWSAVLVVIYRGLVDVFGISSYLPFHVTLIAVHVFAASGVLALLLQVTSSRGLALALTTVFLAFGAGSDNLLWAFQIGFVLATGLGAWALAIAPRRPGVAAVLLTLAVATQGVGLFYLAATAIRIHRSRTVLWLAVPVLVYGTWFLLAGTLGTQPRTIDGVVFFFYGILASAGSLVAGGPVVGVLFVAIALMGWRAGTLTVWSGAAVSGLVAGFLLIALARGGLGPSLAAAPRYLYVCAPFVLIIAAETWHAIGRRPSIQRLGPVFLALALVLNIAALMNARGLWDQQLAAEARIPAQERGIEP